MQLYQIQRTTIDRNYRAVLIFTMGTSAVTLLSNIVFWSLQCLSCFVGLHNVFSVLLGIKSFGDETILLSLCLLSMKLQGWMGSIAEMMQWHH